MCQYLAAPKAELAHIVTSPPQQHPIVQEHQRMVVRTGDFCDAFSHAWIQRNTNQERVRVVSAFPLRVYTRISVFGYTRIGVYTRIQRNTNNERMRVVSAFPWLVYTRISILMYTCVRESAYTYNI